MRIISALNQSEASCVPPLASVNSDVLLGANLPEQWLFRGAIERGRSSPSDKLYSWDETRTEGWWEYHTKYVTNNLLSYVGNAKYVVIDIEGSGLRRNPKSFEAYDGVGTIEKTIRLMRTVLSPDVKIGLYDWGSIGKAVKADFVCPVHYTMTTKLQVDGFPANSGEETWADWFRRESDSAREHAVQGLPIIPMINMQGYHERCGYYLSSDQITRLIEAVTSLYSSCGVAVNEMIVWGNVWSMDKTADDRARLRERTRATLSHFRSRLLRART